MGLGGILQGVRKGLEFQTANLLEKAKDKREQNLIRLKGTEQRANTTLSNKGAMDRQKSSEVDAQKRQGLSITDAQERQAASIGANTELEELRNTNKEGQLKLGSKLSLEGKDAGTFNGVPVTRGQLALLSDEDLAAGEYKTSHEVALDNAVSKSKAQVTATYEAGEEVRQKKFDKLKDSDTWKNTLTPEQQQVAQAAYDSGVSVDPAKLFPKKNEKRADAAMIGQVRSILEKSEDFNELHPSLQLMMVVKAGGDAANGRTAEQFTLTDEDMPEFFEEWQKEGGDITELMIYQPEAVRRFQDYAKDHGLFTNTSGFQAQDDSVGMLTGTPGDVTEATDWLSKAVNAFTFFKQQTVAERTAEQKAARAAREAAKQ